MYEILIKTQPGTEYVEITGEDLAEFSTYTDLFLSIANDSNSPYYVDNSEVWRRLCSCIEQVMVTIPGYCPTIFDSLLCFNTTRAGHTQTAPCPADHPVFNAAQSSASKECQEDATWWKHPETNLTWSDYTDCVPVDHFHHSMSNLTVFGLSLSLIFLIMSLIIFFSFPSLSCGRVTMHKNLFIAIVLSNISWLVYYFFLLEKYFINADVLWCQALHIFTTYFTVTTYFWMMCEGAYLQLLLLDAFHKDKYRVWGLIILGWLFPLLLIIIYYSIVYDLRTELCWSDFGDTNWFLAVPVIIIILLNIVFLSNVIRMLKSKLHADTPAHNTGRRNTRYRINKTTMKQTKSAIFLIPILGINYLILPIRPEPGTTSKQFEQLYDFFSSFSSSFQGFFVSLLLCFTNNEVISLIKKRWNQFSASRNINFSFRPLVPLAAVSQSDNHTEY